MFGRLLRRATPEDAIATRVYGAIVAQARNPFFYSDLGVPDTVTGRFEMVVLHVVLVLDRLQGDDREKALGQKIFDLYCVDMDRSLRELGIGDLGVPKRMRKMTEAFYGRTRAYRAGLAKGDAALLAAAIARNVFAGQGQGAGTLAAYTLASAGALAGTPTAALLAEPRFADVAAFVVADAHAGAVA
jgi:cytochrome b pre-mRNA-processing protein 3